MLDPVLVSERLFNRCTFSVLKKNSSSCLTSIHINQERKLCKTHPRGVINGMNGGKAGSLESWVSLWEAQNTKDEV